MAIQLARAHPGLQLKLQDLPDRMVQAENLVWPAQCPEAMKEKRIEFKAIDFFAEAPIVGCDVYYVSERELKSSVVLITVCQMKNILHAFPSPQCLTILKGIRKSMKPGSRVLIREFVCFAISFLSSVNQTNTCCKRLLAAAIAPTTGNSSKPLHRCCTTTGRGGSGNTTSTLA